MGSENVNPGKEQESVLVTSLDTDGLISDLQQMIDDARATVSVSVNAGLTFLYWRIGQRLNREILKGKRADYGKGILATVLQQLSPRRGIFHRTAAQRAVGAKTAQRHKKRAGKNKRSAGGCIMTAAALDNMIRENLEVLGYEGF